MHRKMKRVINSLHKEAKAISAANRKCIICQGDAEYCMRGMENNTYCRDCALEYFKFLNYLEKLA